MGTPRFKLTSRGVRGGASGPGLPKGPGGQQKRGSRGEPPRPAQRGVIGRHNFAEIELVGEPLPFGLVENPLVVVVAVSRGRTLMQR